MQCMSSMLRCSHMSLLHLCCCCDSESCLWALCYAHFFCCFMAETKLSLHIKGIKWFAVNCYLCLNSIDIRQNFCPLHEIQSCMPLFVGNKLIQSCISQYLACPRLLPRRWSPSPAPHWRSGPDRPPWHRSLSAPSRTVVRGWCRHAGSASIRSCSLRTARGKRKTNSRSP